MVKSGNLLLEILGIIGGTAVIFFLIDLLSAKEKYACPKCEAEIRAGQVRCPKCNTEIQWVRKPLTQ